MLPLCLTLAACTFDSPHCTPRALYADRDSDGFGAGQQQLVCLGDPGFVGVDRDCDDADAAAHPDAQEACLDGVDNDCDGTVDCEDSECAASSQCLETACHDGIDDDSDGWADCLDDDCWGVDGCSVDASLRIESGTLQRRTSHVRSTSTFVTGYSSAVTVLESLDVDIDAQVSGSVRFTTGDGGSRSCAFTQAELTMNGSRPCIGGCGGEAFPSLRSATGACPLDALLPQQVSAPGTGPYSIGGQLLFRASTTHSHQTGTARYGGSTAYKQVFPAAQPVVLTLP